MARGLNRAMIIGFVEREPEKRYTPQGQAVTSFSVSTSRRWTTNAGQTRQAREWFRIVVWGQLAEKASRMVHEGQRVYVEGHIQSRSWEDKDGRRCDRIEVVAHTLIPMGERDTLPAEYVEQESEATPLCLNRIMVIGNLGRDPEMRYTPSGQAVTSYSLAATRTWATASGERRDATEWFNVVSWGSLAEICNQYLSKGRRVYVEGELRTRGWEDADGKRRFRTELVANEMIMLGPRPSGNGASVAPGSTQEELPF